MPHQTPSRLTGLLDFSNLAALALLVTILCVVTTSSASASSRDRGGPSAPSALSVASSTGTGIKLVWAASQDNVAVTGYNVYVGRSKVGSTASTSYLFSGLSCGTAYTLGVQAYDAARNRSSTSKVSVTTAACTPPPPPPAPAPADTSPPTISGTPLVGSALTASRGSWSGSPTGYSYQWRHCDSSGANCANLGGATASSYIPASGDVGATVRVVVTASNADGATSASSAQTGMVAAAPAGPQLPPPTYPTAYEPLYPTNASFAPFTSPAWSTSGGGFDGNATGQPTSGYFQVVQTPNEAQLPFDLPYSYKLSIDGSAHASYDSVNQRSNIYAFPSGSANGTDGRSHAYQGSDAWYRDFVYLDSNYQPNPNTSFNWLIEMHNWPDGPCCANLSFGVDTGTESPGSGNRLALRVLGGGSPGNGVDQLADRNANDNPTPAGFYKQWFDLAPMQRQHWYDIVFHVLWTYQDAGLVQVWIDGNQVVNVSGVPTLYYYGIDNNSSLSGNTPGPGRGYFMLSNYRSGSGYTALSTVYDTGTLIGPTTASIGGTG